MLSAAIVNEFPDSSASVGCADTNPMVVIA